VLFFFILLVFFMTVCFIAKRNLKFYEIFTTTFFGVWLRLKFDSLFVDHFNFYHYFDKEPSMIVFIFFPIFYFFVNYLVLNWYPKNSSKTLRVLYILLWSAFSLFIEELALRYHMIVYDNWSLFESAICYPFILVLLFSNLKIINYLVDKKA
jgi:hypothetical protein